MTDRPFDAKSVAEATEAAMKAFEREKDKLANLRQQLAESDETVRSKDRSIAMTFDVRGELVGMKFLTNKFRSMAPAELAHAIVETVQTGRTQFMEKLDAHLGDSLPGVKMSEIAAGKADLQAVAESLLGPIFGDMNGLFDQGKQSTKDKER
ncbi:YbaB/EbfC family DNA-binding protein [Actinophytocola oryzae]|uniref:YbaB/EbfC DNA-binding family protein n=1 Tax=Actinophytocola oryzae TaxID=502181 RepID=A0A4R7UQN3_9PSEU|nr:YbaB/EbfC family DNA-binding protein [Actinophytocola oryzae]TDV34600.1 hypothetical protein CLV71_13815 [Actinophytocola oryzae]